MAGRLCVYRKLSSFVFSAGHHRSNARKLNSPFLSTSASSVNSTCKPVLLLAPKMTSEAKPRALSSAASLGTDTGEGHGVVVEGISGCTQLKPAEGASVESEPCLSSDSMATDEKQTLQMETIRQDVVRGCRGELLVQEGSATEESGGEVLGEEESMEGGSCEVGEGQSESDKFLYMQRGFTSEIFKIEIQNIPKYIGYTVRKTTVHFTRTCAHTHTRTH